MGRMSMGRKLWFGFGALIAVILTIGLAVVLGTRNVQTTLNELIERDEPARAASYEMEINT